MAGVQSRARARSASAPARPLRLSRYTAAMRALLLLASLAVAATSASAVSAAPSKSTKVVATPTKAHAENLKAAATIYRVATLEEMKLFAVTDRVVELSMSGKLPIGGAADEAIYEYLKGSSSKLDTSTRRRIYGHVLGRGKKAAGLEPNRSFAGLMTRFAGSVAAYERQVKLAGGNAAKVSTEQVHEAARDLALNLSNHAYGAPVVAAPLLQAKADLAIEILSAPAVLKKYGAKTPWEVVERVAKELGKTVDASKLRKHADAGAQVIGWLADVSNVDPAWGGSSAEDLDLADSRVPGAVRDLPRTPKAKHAPTAKPSEVTKVVAACFDDEKKLVPCKVQSKG